MSDYGDIYQEMKEEKQKKHAEWWEKNVGLLKESGLNYRVASRESIIFRDEDKPKVDFYPSTGRWRDVGTNRTYRGGAKAFIIWYKKQ